MQQRPAIALLTLLCWALATPSYADLTAFVGANTTPSNRAVRGFALGLSLPIIGFEFEYSDSIEEEMVGSPSLRTGMFNVLVQTPFPIAGLQFYGTMGGGLYRERLGTDSRDARWRQRGWWGEDCLGGPAASAGGLSCVHAARESLSQHATADLHGPELGFLVPFQLTARHIAPTQPAGWTQAQPCHVAHGASPQLDGTAPDRHDPATGSLSV